MKRLLRTFGRDEAAQQEIQRSLRKLAENQRDQTVTVQRALGELTDALSQRATAKEAGEILDAVRALGRQFERSVDDQLAHGGSAEQQRLVERRLHREIDRIAAGSAPIVVGPWTGEVGFELLYWIPFVEWVRTRWNISAERLLIVSRGGVASWYGMRDAAYADVFSCVTPAQFREATNQEEHKQRRKSAFDSQVLHAITRTRDLDEARHLHPESMYRVFMPYWRDEAGFSTIERFTRYERREPPADPMLERLPEEYIAARFYFNDSFPDTPQNRAFAHAVIAGVSARLPVVLLNPQLAVDDHSDYATAESERVLTIGSALTPERNLAVQTAVIGRSRAFVGTYGGYSYLAPFHNVPTLAFYSTPAFKLHHLHVAQRVFERIGAPTVMPIDVAQAALVQAALASLVAA